MSVTPLARISATHAAPVFRGRIGQDARSGHYAVPRRYRLHLAAACADGLRIAVVHSLLGLDDICPVTLLDPVPDCPDGGHSVLRPLYEASAHRYTGAAVAPVLSDDWSGRIVSTHATDITRDLARHFGGGRPALYPCGAESETDAVERMSGGIAQAAQQAGSTGGDDEDRVTALEQLLDSLGSLERWLVDREFLIRDHITAADVELWVTLVQLDTVHRHHLDAAAVQRIAGHPTLWAYARRLTAHPAFGTHLDLDGIARRHHAHCQGLEAAGAAVQILDWAAHAARPFGRS
ncbi:glutathione S-transferase C-terminal domain-containing protein [Streptomyces canus]|uniref:glutathione S-transferase C-terminal domain-containing protein n=1 Tax=Streptomyces canus TaxID=58343 RepID=UPI0036A323AC